MCHAVPALVNGHVQWGGTAGRGPTGGSMCSHGDPNPPHRRRNAMKRIEQQYLKGLLLGSVALLAMGVLAVTAHAEAVEVWHSTAAEPATCRSISLAPAAVGYHIADGDTTVNREARNGA